MKLRRNAYADMHVQDLAAIVAKKWAGRCICAGDLATIYGIDPRKAGNVFARLKGMDAIADERAMGGRNNITTYRLRA
jgi:alkylated DNA nucleotide flippase Atl1